MKCIYRSFLSLFGLLCSADAVAGEISWRVAKPFLPYSTPHDPEELNGHWLPRNVDGSGQPESFVEWYRRLFSQGPGSKGRSPYLSGGVAGEKTVRPHQVDIVATIAGVQGLCTWSVLNSTGEVRVVHDRVSCESRDLKIGDVEVEGASLLVSNGENRWSERVSVERLVIVGLGDSYASGEGNPDTPAKWKPRSAPENHRWLASPAPGKDEVADDSLLASPAEWVDPWCRRSFFSNQTYVAMRLAVESPHRHVTFLHYACSGAEVFDGLLVRQDVGKRTLEMSQLSAMMRSLCVQTLSTKPTILEDRPRRYVRRTSGVSNHSLAKPFRVREKMRQFRDHGVEAFTCETPVMPDAILVSIGGNDIGFADLVKWALLPDSGRGFHTDFLLQAFRSSSVLCPAERWRDDGRCDRTIERLLDELPIRLNAFARTLEDVLPGSSSRVVLSAYPVGTTAMVDGGLRRCGDPGRQVNPLNPWDGIRSLGAGKDWEVNFTQGEAWYFSRSAPTLTMPRLQAALRSSAARNGFTFAEAVQVAFDGHGWCRVDVGDAPLALPSRAPQLWQCESVDGNLLSGAPACWAPYRPTSRYIRTVNDSLLTQMSDRGDAMWGAAHPNGIGHAAIADALYPYVADTVRRASNRSRAN